jgi:hypothetical protein
MCTVVLRLTPDGGSLLLGIRDEFLGRPWLPPAAHWQCPAGQPAPTDLPGSPLIGGLDEQAGGTWLAVHPGERRVACVLNGRGTLAPAAPARHPCPPHQSRGDLPLRAASGEQVTSFGDYDPFHLVCADSSGGWVLSWDGEQAVRSALGTGTHLFTNGGYVYPSDDPDDKGAYFGPRFAAAPSLRDWAVLARGDGLATDDPRAIIVRRELPDGRVWGTSSVSMVQIGDAVRYEFGVPGEELAPVISSSSTGASRRSSSK